MRKLLLPFLLLCCSLWSRGPRPPCQGPAVDGVELGQTRAQVERFLGPGLDRSACMNLYDMPVCAMCMTRDCGRVSFAVYPGAVTVVYDCQERAFRIQGQSLELPVGTVVRVGDGWCDQLGAPLRRQGGRLQRQGGWRLYPHWAVNVDDRGVVTSLVLFRPWVCAQRSECGWDENWWLRDP